MASASQEGMDTVRNEAVGHGEKAATREQSVMVWVLRLVYLVLYVLRWTVMAIALIVMLYKVATQYGALWLLPSIVLLPIAYVAIPIVYAAHGHWFLIVFALAAPFALFVPELLCMRRAMRMEDEQADSDHRQSLS
jgi:hypothetical protein